jgi:hypothetical protein
MASLNTISLVIPPEPSAKSQTLGSQVQQIIAQRGAFRHVTESSILAEEHIKSSYVDDVFAGQDEVEIEEDDESAQQREERSWKVKGKMLEQLK